jgi:hypothetical protein
MVLRKCYAKHRCETLKEEHILGLTYHHAQGLCTSDLLDMCCSHYNTLVTSARSLALCVVVQTHHKAVTMALHPCQGPRQGVPPPDKRSEGLRIVMVDCSVIHQRPLGHFCKHQLV